MTIGTHFCGGKILEAKVLFGETHLGCGMMEMEVPCNESENSNKKEPKLDKTTCCQDEYQSIQLTEDFVQDAAQLTFNVDFAIAIVYATLNLDLFPTSTQYFYTEYNSPPIEKDIQVFFQTFLI